MGCFIWISWPKFAPRWMDGSLGSKWDEIRGEKRALKRFHTNTPFKALLPHPVNAWVIWMALHFGRNYVVFSNKVLPNSNEKNACIDGMWQHTLKILIKYVLWKLYTFTLRSNHCLVLWSRKIYSLSMPCILVITIFEQVYHLNVKSKYIVLVSMYFFTRLYLKGILAEGPTSFSYLRIAVKCCFRFSAIKGNTKIPYFNFKNWCSTYFF